MKTAIIYESKHHGNTKKVCDAIAKSQGVKLFDAEAIKGDFPWDEYDMIGFASGISFSKFYNHVTKIASKVPAGKKTFYIYTCAKNDKDFAADIKAIAEANGAIILGTYGCRGFNTFGPLKLIGGMNKSNPDKDELQAAVEFYKDMETKYEK